MPDGALPYEWPDLPEDADPLRPPASDADDAVRLADDEPEPEISGFDPDTSVELVEEREEYSRTYENEDGTLATDFSLEPLHYEEDGSWEQIDTTLVPENTATWTNAADSQDVAFASHADGEELARMELDGQYSLAFSLEGAAGAEGQVSESDADTILYEEALPNVDIELKSLVGGVVKETIWLNEPPAGEEDATWRFPLALEGLEPVLLEDGSIDLVDGDGEPVGHIPAGHMEDSDIDPRSGDGAWSEAVRFDLVEENGQWVLEVEADFAWLSDEDRVYPVGVDPTSTWNYNASQDTYVQSGFNTSRHTEQELKAGTYDGGSTRTASYLKFNSMVSALRHHKIYGAELYLFNHWSYSCTPSPVSVHEVTQSWDHKSISNFPGPNYNSTALGTESFARGWMPIGASSSSCPARYEGINLGNRGRDLIQAWVDGDKANHGLTVRASNTSSSGWKKFGSRESWGAPYMTVTYSPYRADYAFAQSPPVFEPAPHANRTTNVDVRVTNRGKETWTPSNGYKLSYQVFDEQGKRVYHVAPTTAMPRNVATGQTATVSAKVGPLPPGTWTIKFDMTHKAQTFAAWGVPMTAQVELEIPDLPPQLLDYSPRDGARVATLEPEFTALGRNNDAWPTAGMEFWFNFCDGEWPDWECVDSGWQDETTWKLPEDRMRWGNQYWWNVFVRDGSQMTESGWLRLIAEPDQPAVTSNLAGSGGADGAGTVDALIGNYTETVTDASLPSAGPPLSITRTYNSSDPRQNGIFGAGWSTRFDMGLVPDVDGTGNVVVTYPDGRQHRFARNADASFTPPSGMHAVLSRTESGWKLMDKASTTYAFDDAGRLLEVTDHRGRAQTIDYDSSGLISTVTAEGGRTLAFTWDNARVTSVTAQGGDTEAQWSYTYDGQRLSQACNPENECTSYTYADGSHYQAAAMDANPYGYWRFEETSGETSLNEVPQALGGEPADIVGSPLGAQGALAGVQTGALQTSSGSHAQLPESILHEVGTRITLETWFATTEHGTIIGAQNKPTSPGERTPLVYVGTDGKLRAQFWTTSGEAAPITTDGTVDDGRWHHVALTSDGTSQTLYLNGEQVGTKTGQVDHRSTKFVYVGTGVASSAWPQTRSTTGEFPFTGKIDEVALYQRPLDADTIALHHTAGVDEADRLHEATTPEGNRATHLTFDESTSRAQIHIDHNGGKWVYSNRTYDGDVRAEDPQVTAEVTIQDPGGAASSSRYDALAGHRRSADVDQLGYETAYTYDVGGFLVGTTLPSGAQRRFWNDARGNRLGQMSCRDVEATNCHWEWFAYHHNPDDPFDSRNDQLVAHHDARSENFLDPAYRTWWAYNAHGDQISETSPPTEGFPDGRTVRHFYTEGTEAATGSGTVPAGLLAESWDADGGKTRYSYNEHGDITRVAQPSGLVTEYTYDGLGRMLTTTAVTDAFPDGVTTTVTYDDAGRVLTETDPEVANELTDTSHQSLTRYAYDRDGRPIRSTVSDLVGESPDRVTMWAYNHYGHLVAETDPEGRTEHFGYDFTGARTHHRDAAGTMFRTTYTDRGHIAERIIDGWTGHPGEDNEPSSLVLESNAYDPDGNLASTTDAVGRTTAYTYYADGLPAQTIASQVMLNNADEPQDVVLEDNTYDAAGNLTRSVTGDGATRVDREWSADSRLTRETLDPDGLARVTAYTYDGRGNVTETALSDSSETTERTRFTYDAGGHLIEEAVVTAEGELVTSYQLDELGLTTAVTDPRGNRSGADAADFTSHMRYDELGRLVQEQSPEVEITHHAEPALTARPTTRYGYDLVGNLTHQQDAEGHTSVFGYDLVGQRTRSQAPGFTGADGTRVTPEARADYDQLGRISAQTDALGNTRTYTWDQLGNLAGITDPQLEGLPEAGQWTFAYNPVGELLAATDPVEARTEATYDDLGRQVTDTQIERVPAAAAYTSRYAYDTAGNPVSVTDPLGNQTTSTYNPAGELVQTTTPTGETTEFDHDLVGRTTRATDPAGTRTISEYDLAGRLTSTRMVDAEGEELRTSTTEYDAAGLAIEQTDPLGQKVEIEYNALGRPTRQVEPVSDTETITTTFGYDALGQRTRITDGRGNSTYTTYTPNGQVQDLIEPGTDATPDLADRTWTTFYDAAGNPVQQHVPGGIVRERTYNAMGGLTKETATGAATATEDRNIGFDLLGRPIGIGTPGGAIEIVYDDRGNQVQFLGPTTVSYEGIAPGTTTSYDAAGRVDTRLDMTGTTTFDYDASGRVVGHHDPVTGTDLAIDYNQAGLPEHVTTSDGAVRSFSYDPLSQLTEDTLLSSAGEQTVSTTYAYDRAGRITERSSAGGTPAGSHRYAYDYASRLVSWTSPENEETEYAWDASGNRVRAAGETFEYDERNRLTSSSDGDAWSYDPNGTISSQFVDGQLRTPQFDGFERMVSAGNGSGEYSYDALGRVTEREAPGGEAQTFVYPDLQNNPVGILDGTETPVSQYGRDPYGQLMSVADRGQAPALAYSNSHGDVLATHTGTGSVVTSADFGPFGEQLEAGPAASMGYQGEWTDPDTGDVNMHARWYQPDTGRFASRDTVAIEPSPSVQANRYTYGNANPVSNTDPTGHFAFAIPFAFSFSFSFAAFFSVAIPVVSIGVAAYAGWSAYSYLSSRTYTAPRFNVRTNYGYGYPSVSVGGWRWTGRSWAFASGAGVASGGTAVWGGRYGWTGSRGGVGVRHRPPVIVDNRKDILRRILNTPQPRPPMRTLVSQGEVDSQRLAEEERVTPEVAEVDYDDLYEDLKADYVDRAPMVLTTIGRVDNEDCHGQQHYGPIVDKRHTGAVALFCSLSDLEGGSDAAKHIRPPGWPSRGQDPSSNYINERGAWEYQRGHLIGNQLGGSGTRRENLVTMHAHTNSPTMREYEDRVIRAVEASQVVVYQVTPVYQSGRLDPVYIHLQAAGSGGLSFDVCLTNETRSTVLSGNHCRANRG
ncbi:DNRLRE domain-containing protein [Nocardiopsis sp. NPDC101807]|uniref:DNRLRE domain-containing protein n=1 Tax=Nocardiopsis sp. NPDC101807 TaxID=3364339 RepID=UPI00380CC796